MPHAMHTQTHDRRTCIRTMATDHHAMSNLSKEQLHALPGVVATQDPATKGFMLQVSSCKGGCNMTLVVPSRLWNGPPRYRG